VQIKAVFDNNINHTKIFMAIYEFELTSFLPTEVTIGNEAKEDHLKLDRRVSTTYQTVKPVSQKS